MARLLPSLPPVSQPHPQGPGRGAFDQVGAGVRVRETARIEIPWNLEIGNDTVVGDEAILYSLGKIRLGRKVVISQYAHLCAGTHDYTSDAMALLCPPITVGDEVWIAADAFVGPGVTIGARSVVAFSPPMRSRMVSRPVRRGLRLTPWMCSSDPGTSVAATMNGAAEEKSPGTSISPASSQS